MDSSGTSGGSGPRRPVEPTEPIRPLQPGSEPIPERMRQPVVVPHQEPTVAGLPRPLVIAAIVVLLLALLVGFLIGRALGGDDASEEGATGRRAACARALAISLQVGELQREAIANRTQAIEALVAGDEAQLQELTTRLEEVSAEIAAAEGKLTPAVERCGSGEGRAGGGGRDRGGAGGRGAKGGGGGQGGE